MKIIANNYHTTSGYCLHAVDRRQQNIPGGCTCASTGLFVNRRFIHTVKISVYQADISWRVFHILTEPVPCTFLSVDRRNNEARIHYSVDLPDANVQCWVRVKSCELKLTS